MDLIYKLKNWYSLEEGAGRIQKNFSQEITIQNLLEFVNDEHISLYWNLDHHPAKEIEIMAGGDNNFSKKQDTAKITFLSGPHLFSISPNYELEDYYKSMSQQSSVTDILEHCVYEDFPFDGIKVLDSNGSLWLLQRQISTEELEENNVPEMEPFLSTKRYKDSIIWPRLTDVGFTKRELEQFETKNLDQKIESITKPSNNIDNENLSPKEKNTLLKLIIGIAIEQYGYKPKAARNEATKHIETDLAAQGVPLDRDTILKWLREASHVLPDDPQA